MMFGALPQPAAVCGLYYIPKTLTQQERFFLPQVQLEAHATILQTTSRVTLTQTFINPSTSKGIHEVGYVFPLYEGVSVVGFTCNVDDRIIVGKVKEKNQAKHDYTAAVAQGKVAGLFEQLDAADTFKTTIGNVPPGARVVVKLTYLGELKHDMEVDGIRFTIPHTIAPRYGNTAPGYDIAFNGFQRLAATHGGPLGNITITVDMEMAEGSFIRKVLSPSHPISVSMGTTSVAPNDDPELTKASATISVRSPRLENDFILQIVAKDTGVPKAVLETHPTIPNQRALMATLVPKFVLPPERPEIVFICDRSGSMSGSGIALARQALQVFLKSLPVGVMFNICSFGSHYSFLWPRSVSYSQQTLDEAVAHVSSFSSNYGGTEMLAPVKATLQQRYKDIPIEVMILTDGCIQDQTAMFSYLNEQVRETNAPIRVYSLGVGSSVSHSLVEGLARAGNGFSQSVGEGEKMDSKVVRMLKGALSPHVNDYTLEVKYQNSTEMSEEDDFEIVERVADSLTVKLNLDEQEDKPKSVSAQPQDWCDASLTDSLAKPISLFDSSADLDSTDPPSSNNKDVSRFAHLPEVQIPRVIQAPQTIPTLFAFNRTTVYVLLGPDAPQQMPKSIVLRGTSAHGPLELEFPIQVLDKPGETIHQLAVKKATYELEEGRGWLSAAKDESGKSLKERYDGRFSSMVEREAVRLGVQFQVSGKWCSFVAVEKDKKSEKKRAYEQWEFLEDEPIPNPPAPRGGLFGFGAGGHSLFGTNPGQSNYSPSFGSATEQAVQSASTSLFAPPNNQGGGLFGGMQQQQQQQHQAPPSTKKTNDLFPKRENDSLQHYQSSLMLVEQQNKKRLLMARQESDDSQNGATTGASSHPVNSIPPNNQSGGLFGGPQQKQSRVVHHTLQGQPNITNVSPTAGQPFGHPGGNTSFDTLGLASDDSGLLENFDFDSFLHVPSTTQHTAFGQASAQPSTTQHTAFGQVSAKPSHTQPQGGGLFGASVDTSTQAGLFGSRSTQPLQPPSQGASSFGAPVGAFNQPGSSPHVAGAPNAFGTTVAFGAPLFSASNQPTQAPVLFGKGTGSSAAPKTDDEILALIISLQSFEGAWEYSPPLFTALKLTEATLEDGRTIFNYDLSFKAATKDQERKVEYSKAEWATALVIAYLEERLASLQGSWELIVDKARSWLEGRVGEGKLNLEEVLGRTKVFLREKEGGDRSKARFGQ